MHLKIGDVLLIYRLYIASIFILFLKRFIKSKSWSFLKSAFSLEWSLLLLVSSVNQNSKHT